MSDAVLYSVDSEGIATITINRPEQRNCLSKEVRAGLFAAWDRFEQDASARIAILTGSGEKAFCAGGDLKEMVETGLKVPPRDMFPVQAFEADDCSGKWRCLCGRLDDCAGMRLVRRFNHGQICDYRGEGRARIALGCTINPYDPATDFYGDCSDG
jgi:Enoyl-CoA hydratase/isomerase